MENHLGFYSMSLESNYFKNINLNILLLCYKLQYRSINIGFEVTAQFECIYSKTYTKVRGGNSKIIFVQN
jgi:hypothetical protein